MQANFEKEGKNQMKMDNYMKEITSKLLVISKDFANSFFFHSLFLSYFKSNLEISERTFRNL